MEHWTGNIYTEQENSFDNVHAHLSVHSEQCCSHWTHRDSLSLVNTQQMLLDLAVQIEQNVGYITKPNTCFC